MITIAVLNLKGGTTKTTTAAYLLHALHESGLRAIGVDADGENDSLADWQADADWSVPVVGMAVNNLHKQLPGLVDDRYDAVVIDTPPMREHRNVVVSAARMATHVVVPMAPTAMEHKRLPAVLNLLDEVSALRSDGRPPLFAVLFTRTVANAASTKVYRELITADGVTVLRPTVGRLERFAQAYGDPVRDAINTAYGDALTELLDLEAAA